MGEKNRGVVQIEFGDKDGGCVESGDWKYIPLNHARGLLNKTHTIVPNWKPFNQEDESTWPEKRGEYIIQVGGIYEVGVWRNNWRLISCSEQITEPVTKYMPIPEG